MKQRTDRKKSEKLFNRKSHSTHRITKIHEASILVLVSAPISFSRLDAIVVVVVIGFEEKMVMRRCFA